MIVVVQEYGSFIGKRSNRLYMKTGDTEQELCLEQISELHIYPSCSISSDALQICMKKEVWVAFFDRYGNPEGEIVPFSGGCAPIYKRKQLLLIGCEEGVKLVKEFQCKKIENRIRQLKQILRKKRKNETVLYLSVRITKMEEELAHIQNLQAFSMNDAREHLQGFEGTAGRAYFECISYLLPEDMKFSKRMRNAEDVYNCALNYLYGIMYAKIKKMMYQCRLDPYIGIMHVDTYNKPTFVYDFIEGYRIICEEIAYEICAKQLIKRTDMEEVEGRLRFVGTAKNMLVSRFYARMNEKCTYRRKQISYEKKIYLELLDVAKRIGELKTDVLSAV